MEILVKRKTFLEDTTLGEMYIDDVYFCKTLEDKDRGYSKDTPKSVIEKNKVIGSSAIPYGRYRLIMSYSIKLKRYLPLLLDVPLGKGIRIHNGSTFKNTSGCLLVGFELKKDKLVFKSSKEAEQKLVNILDVANKKEPLYITIEKA